VLVVERESVCSRTKFFLYLPLSNIHSFYFTFFLLLHTVSLSLSLFRFLSTTHTHFLFISLYYTHSLVLHVHLLSTTLPVSLYHAHTSSPLHTHFSFVYSREKESVSVFRRGNVCVVVRKRLCSREKVWVCV
jgi:hypothetical protein